MDFNKVYYGSFESSKLNQQSSSLNSVRRDKRLLRRRLARKANRCKNIRKVCEKYLQLKLLSLALYM